MRLPKFLRKFVVKPERHEREAHTTRFFRSTVTPPITPEYMLRLYSISDWVYTGVSYLVNACITVPYEVRRRSEPRVIIPKQRSLLAPLLENPNPFLTEQEFFEKVFLSLELTGNCFIEKVFSNPDGGYKLLKELYVVNPKYISIIPDPKTYVKGYIYTTDEGEEVFFYPDEMIHIRYTHPNNDYWGLSPLQAVLRKLKIDFNVTEFIESFFANDAVPGGIFFTDRILSDPVRKRIKKSLERRHSGSKKAFSFALLEGGLSYEKVGSNFGEVQYQDLGNSLRDHVLSALGIPPSLVGVNTNYATARVQQSLFYDSVVYPRLKRVAAAIDGQIFAKYSHDEMFTFDISTTPINVIKLSASSRVISRLYILGLLNLNEARSLVGLRPIEGGDKIFYSRKVSAESQLAGKPTTGEKEEGA